MSRSICAAVALTVVAARGEDAGAPGRVRVTVRCIRASAGDGSVDPRLAPIQQHIQAFADQSKFRTFKLEQEQTFDLDWRTPAQMELPGSRSLQVTPRQLSPDGKIKVHLELLGEHPAHVRRVHTDYSIPKGGTILIAGLDQGALLIAVTQEMEKQ